MKSTPRPRACASVSSNETLKINLARKTSSIRPTSNESSRRTFNKLHDRLNKLEIITTETSRWERSAHPTSSKLTSLTDLSLQVKYVLLDCDNTLCQSERLAFEACSELTNQVLEKHKVDARYDVDSLLEDFVGHNFRNMLVGLQKKHNFTMSPEEQDDYVSRELGEVTKKLSEKCKECPGVTEQLE